MSLRAPAPAPFGVDHSDNQAGESTNKGFRTFPRRGRERRSARRRRRSGLGVPHVRHSCNGAPNWSGSRTGQTRGQFVEFPPTDLAATPTKRNALDN